MSDFINPWDSNQETEEQVQPTKSWWSDIFDNAEAYAKATYANTRELGMGSDIKNTYDKLHNKQYSSRQEFDNLVQELDTLQAERDAYRNQFQENQKILNQNDSMLKDFTEIGGTMQGIWTQAKDTAIGAGTGAVIGSAVPVLGTGAGFSTGARVGNFVGSIHQAVNDADMNAVEAWERVLQEGGNPDQAEQAYQDAFWNNMPTEALDIISSMYMGGKLVGSTGKILERALGNKLTGTLVKGVNKVGRFDIPAKIGTAVAKKTGKSWIGQGVGVGVSMLGNGLEEGIQEPWQDYATERAVDIQRRQYDPNHEGIRDFSVFGDGGLLDYYTTPEGRETAWKAAKMGMAFGGIGGLMSKSQFTELGTAHSDSIQAGKQQADWIEKNNILKDKGNLDRYNEVKETMGNIYGLTEDEKADLSVEDVSRMYHEYYANKYGIGGNRQEQGAVTQADFLNEITGEETARRGLMGDTATKYIDEFSLRPDSETLQGIHDNQQVLSEEQVQEVLEQDEQQESEETTGTEDATPFQAKASKPNFFDNKTAEQAKNEKAQSQTENVIKKKKGIPDQFGNWKKIDENDDFDHDLNNIGAEAKFENTKTGRIAHIKRTKSGYQVQDITNPNEQTTVRNKKGKKKLLSFLKSSFANQKTAFQSDGSDGQVQQALPKGDGVISEINSNEITKDAEGNHWFNGKKIQSKDAYEVHSMQDLHDYYKNNKDKMSADLYAEVSRQMMRFGIGSANNTSIVLDLSNSASEAGGFGSETVFRTDPNDPNSAIARAVVRLYAGADLATAAHEMAHLGWINLSDQDRATFAKWATKTQGEFVAKVLGMNYDQNFRSYLIEALTNRESETSKALWIEIQRQGAVQQTLAILNGQNAQNYDLAVEERFAWEFSNWYAQGYIKGSKPRNIIERILNKACATLQGALNLLSDTNRYLNGEDGYNGGEINSIFTNMSTERIGQPRQTVAPQVETVTRMDYAPEMGYDLAQGLPNVADSELGFNLDEEPEQNLSGNVGTTRVNPRTQKTQQQKIQTGYGDNVSNQETLEQYKERMKQEAEQKKEEKKQNYTPTPQYQPKERNRKVGGYEQTSPQGETLEQYRKREAEEAEKYKVPTSLKAFRKLLTIVKNRKEGWQRALQSLRQVDPNRFRSAKTQDGNNLWGVGEEYTNDGNDLWGQPQQQSLFGKEFNETKSEQKIQTEENTEQVQKPNTVEQPSLFTESDTENVTTNVTKETPQTEKTAESDKNIQQETQKESNGEETIEQKIEKEKEYYGKKEFEYNGQKYKYDPEEYEFYKTVDGKRIKISDTSVDGLVLEGMRRMDSPFFKKGNATLESAINHLESEKIGAENTLKNTTKKELKNDKQLQEWTKEKNELQKKIKDAQKTINGLKGSYDTRSLESTMEEMKRELDQIEGKIAEYLRDIKEWREWKQEVKQNVPKAIKILKAMYGQKKQTSPTVKKTKTQTQETTQQTQEEPKEQVQKEETIGNNNKEWFEDMKPYFNGKNTSERVLSKTGDYRIVKRGYKVVDENGNPYGKVKYSYDVDQLGMEIDGEYGLESSFPTNDEAKKYLAEKINSNTESNKSQAETPVQSSTTEQPVSTKSEPVVAKNETTEKEETQKEQEELIEKELIEKEKEINKKLDDVKKLFESKDSLDTENIQKQLDKIYDDLFEYSVMRDYSDRKENKFKELYNRWSELGSKLRKILDEEELKKEEQEKLRKEKEEKERIDNIINSVKNVSGVKGLSREGMLVYYETYEYLKKHGNGQVTNLAQENAIVFARLCEHIANTYNQIGGITRSKQTAKTISDKIMLNAHNNFEMKRGAFSFNAEVLQNGFVKDLKDRKIITTALASPSTFLHESTHMYMFELAYIANLAPNSQAAKDFKALMEWAEFEDIDKELEAIKNMSEEKSGVEGYIDNIKKAKTKEQKEQATLWYKHEKIAIAFEEYLRSGKAPTKQLKGVFEKFKRWILDFFKDLKPISVKSPESIESIFKKMILTEEEMKNQESQNKENKSAQKETTQKRETHHKQQERQERNFEDITEQTEKENSENYPTREDALKNPDLSFKRAYFELITTLENGEGDWEELPLNQDGELSPSKSLAAANKALTVLNYGVKNGNPESCFFMAELGTGNWVTNIDLNYESFEDIISERFDYDTEDYIDMYKKAAEAGIKDSYERLSSLYFQEEEKELSDIWEDVQNGKKTVEEALKYEEENYEEVEEEAEEQTSPETKTTTEAKPKTKKTTTKTQTSPKAETATNSVDQGYQKLNQVLVGAEKQVYKENKDVIDSWVRQLISEINDKQKTAKRLGMLQSVVKQGIIEKEVYDEIINRVKNRNKPDTHMQEAGQAAENQTLLTPEKEAELEKLFWKLIRKKEFHGMDKRWNKDSLDYYRSLYNRMQGKDFNPEYVMEDKAFLTAIKNVNDYINKNYKEYKNLYRGVDGHWRFEFSDKDAHFLNGFEKLSGKTLGTTLEKILKHDNLYKFYSKLKEMPVHLVRNEEMQRQMEDTENNYYAMYDPETKSIYINSDMFEQDDVRNSLLHEIQHAIQDIEGFANGTNDNAYNNNYDFSEGEKQAVLTEKRSNMSDEELEKNPRYETLNPKEKTIMSEQRPVKKAAKSPDTKMQSNGQTNLGYIDKQKDIYSVTFTKSAQKNGENQKKIAFYRNNKSYWRENKDAQTGSITFTRALPYRQHQKTIIYDDINGKTVGKKKKTKVREYIESAKDQIIKWLFNDKHFLKKAARNVGAIESYMRMMVMKDQGAVAGAAIEDGIVKHNGKNGERTKSLNSIIEAVGEDNQAKFLDYCEAFRVLDLAKRGIEQKMDTKRANEIINEVQRSKNAKLFEDQRKNFVEYNHELLWVLVDGGFITEKQYDKFIQNDPNFIPLAKNMDELEGYVDGFKDSKTMINVQHPMHKIGTSMREVVNPFLEMQKRTVEYYVKASRNKAGLIFVHDIAEAIAQTAGGNVVAQNQGMIRKLASRDKNGKPISHDNKQYVFYVWENGQKQYYQVADREIYVALKSFDAEQMGALSKIANQTAGLASRLVRDTATMTPDFGLRNLVRDNVEAFISSEHGFLPLVDSLWGMYQMANDTQWFKEYQALNGEHLSLNRDGENVATVEHDIKDNVKFYKSIVPLFKKDLHEFTDTKRSVPARLKSLLKLVAFDIIPLQALYKGNKRLNDYLETGTRIGEYRNARMGYRGLYGRLFEGKGNTIFTNDTDLKMAQMDKMFAAYKAKDITLNFGQHGALGKELNRYIPFFNASLQGIYKVCNTLENMVRADDTRLKQELWFKFVLMGAMGMAAAMAGTGDDDYDEAPEYEHDNFWVFKDGFRLPKDQLFGRLVGGTVEKATRQYLKDGDVKKLELLKDVLGNFAIDKCIPALADLAMGLYGDEGYDSFRNKPVVPSYMVDWFGYQKKDLSTSKLAADISEGLLNVFGVDVAAKKIDFVFSKTLSNLGNYTKGLYDLGTNPNERMTRGAEPEDKGGFAEKSKELPYPLNTIVGTFATNRNTFQSVSDFYNRYKELKKFEHAPERMSKAEKKVWEAYKKAYKDDKKYRDALKAIKQDKSLTGAQKRERADKIFKQQIRMARKLRDYEKKQGLI